MNNNIQSAVLTLVAALAAAAPYGLVQFLIVDYRQAATTLPAGELQNQGSVALCQANPEPQGRWEPIAHDAAAS